MQVKKRDSAELKRKMQGRWLHALLSLAPSLSQAATRVGKSVRCPKEGWPNAFRLMPDVNQTGGGARHSIGVFPTGVDLLMWVNNWSFPKAYDELEAWIGDKPVEAGPIYCPRENPDKVERRKKWLNQLWSESYPIDHKRSYPARAYFGYRKISNASIAAKDVRYHPCVKYYDEDDNYIGSYGAVFLLVRDNNGKPVAIHRTYITQGGHKVDLGKDNKPKKSTPPVDRFSKGRRVQLFEPVNGLLGTAEGLETALSVFQAREFPVWPNLSNTNLHSFRPPKGVHTIINFVDKDRSEAGEKSAIILQENLSTVGVKVINLLPPTPILDSDEKGVDWADQLIRDPSGFELLDQTLSNYGMDLKYVKTSVPPAYF